MDEEREFNFLWEEVATMTTEEYEQAYREVWERRVRSFGETPEQHYGEVWDAMPQEARVRHLMAHYAASWLEDYKHNIDVLCAFTGEDRATMVAFYFGMDARAATKWITRLLPVALPKEPWQS